MVITSPVHAGVRPTAGPAECLRPVFVQFRFVAAELVPQISCAYRLPPRSRRGPSQCPSSLLTQGYELQLSFVEAPVAAYAAL